MIDIKELYWAAGFLEGEGWFGYRLQNQVKHVSGTFRVSAVQVQREPLERLHRMFGGKLWFLRKENPKHSDIWTWEVWGVKALGLMFTLYVLMSPRRQDQIRNAIERWKARPLAARYRTHCLRGHRLTRAQWNNGTHQVCRECARRRSEVWRLKKRGLGPSANQMELLN